MRSNSAAGRPPSRTFRRGSISRSLSTVSRMPRAYRGRSVRCSTDNTAALWFYRQVVNSSVDRKETTAMDVEAAAVRLLRFPRDDQDFVALLVRIAAAVGGLVHL